MSVERCENLQCKRPFFVSEYQLQMPGTKERENIACPNCGHTYTQVSNGFFQTKALSPQEESEFNTKNPLY